MAAHQQFTLTQMQTALTDKWEGVAFWTSTEATNAINEALLMWNLLTGYWKKTISITTTAGNFEYALPTTLVFGTRVSYETKPLAPTDMHSMDNGQPGWQAQTTASGGNVPTSPKKWLPISVDLIAIWPADAVGGHTLTVDGVSQTPRLVNAGDYIDIGEDMLNAILGYALHVAALKEGGARFAATMGMFTEFLRAAAEENDQLTESQMYRHFIGTDQRRQEHPTRGNATEYDLFSQRQP